MDLQTLKDRRAQYLAAEVAILKRQEYSIDVEGGSRRVRFADLAMVQGEIRRLDREIEGLEGAAVGRRRVRYLRASR